MARSAQAQAGFEAVVKVSDGYAAHDDTLWNDFNDCIVIKPWFCKISRHS
jgi:hypothetical protein